MCIRDSFSGAIALVILVLVTSCLNGSSVARMFGLIQCNYQLTSNDSTVKIGGSAVFILFVGLLFGPVLAVLARPAKASKP